MEVAKHCNLPGPDPVRAAAEVHELIDGFSILHNLAKDIQDRTRLLQGLHWLPYQLIT